MWLYINSSKQIKWTVDTCYCTISCSALMPCIETVGVKIILCDLIREMNFITVTLPSWKRSLYIYIYIYIYILTEWF